MDYFIEDGSLTGAAYATTGLAVSGDRVLLPSGSFDWNTYGSNSIRIPSYISLVGSGMENTIIRLSQSGPTSTNGTIVIAGTGALLSGMCFLPPLAGNATTPISTSSSVTGYLGWRITDVKYDAMNSDPRFSYFVYVGKNYGLIDHCTVIGGGGNNELIFTRGPDNSWQTPSQFGSKNAVYVEDCLFSGTGYVCDINDNGRAVLRYNTIMTSMKIDGHGYNTNNDRGVRYIEAYGNRWRGPAGSYNAFEIRGGGGRFFNNRTDNRAGVSVFQPNFELVEYGCTSPGSRFNNVYQTPFNYPITDQVGVGMDPKGANMEPLYLWGNNVSGTHDWTLSWSAVGAVTNYKTNTDTYPAGSTGITIIAGSSTLRTGNYVAFAGDTGRYRIVKSQAGSGLLGIASPGLLQGLASTGVAVTYGAVTNYQGQINDPNASFSISSGIINANRDYFKQTIGIPFDGTSGMGTGTYAQMIAITPTLTGAGFWAADRGNWNKVYPQDNGQLFIWSGDWAFSYEPYQYPFLWSEPVTGVTYVYKRLGRYLKLRGLAPA